MLQVIANAHRKDADPVRVGGRFCKPSQFVHNGRRVFTWVHPREDFIAASRPVL